VARWEPNARERFVYVAVDLFAEQGYEATTVNEIAERAGLTKTTFFRHFPDKREVLFAGQDIHRKILSEAIGGAPAAATPIEQVAVAVDALSATFTEDRREFSARLQTVMAGNPELQERAAFKRTALAAALTEALEHRGVPPLTAGLAAELGIRAFHEAYDRWATPGSREPLTVLTRQALDDLRLAIAALG
jgi:AcrR family transcriptional regulator